MCKLQRMRLRLIIVLVFITSFSFSQNSKEFSKKWELAKGHYEDENYDIALMIFKSLSSENSENQYVEYANYYTALTLFKQEKLLDSRQYLLQLQNKYPYWEKIQNAKYLQANIEFIKENYTKAVSLLDSCETKDCKNLKLHYLSKIESLALLQKLSLDYPEDAEIGTVYCFNLAKKQPLFQSDKDEIYQLIEKHNIKNSKLKSILEESSENHFKDTFNLTVLYPFFEENLQNNINKRRNQFVIDHYWGLNEAVDTLSKSGIQLKLHLYDTENDTNKVKSILAQDELKQMDLLIGPVYSQNMKLVSKFATENQIVNFNPLLSSAENLTDSGFVYLYNPTQQSIGTKSAEFILDSFPNKKIMVLSYDNPKDNKATYAFIERLKQDSVSVAKQITIDKGEDVLSVLSRVKNDEVDVIFTPSTNTSIGTNLISWQIIREITIPVIGNAKWLKAREYNISQANGFSSYFFDSQYKITSIDSTMHFEKKYFNNYNLPPSEAAFKGYDLGMFIGQNLAKYGKYFNQALWNMESQKGVFYPEFNYNSSYYNNFVPILKLKDYQLVPVNFVKKNKPIEESEDEQPKE